MSDEDQTAAVTAHRNRMIVPITRNERGFATGAFQDLYDEPCSIQDSSLATEAAVWVGLDHGTHVDGHCLARMHLNREQARGLAWHLLRFAKTGSIAESSPEEQLANIYAFLRPGWDAQEQSDADLCDAACEASSGLEPAQDAPIQEVIDRFMIAKGILETPKGLKSSQAIAMENT